MFYCTHVARDQVPSAFVQVRRLRTSASRQDAKLCATSWSFRVVPWRFLSRCRVDLRRLGVVRRSACLVRSWPIGNAGPSWVWCGLDGAASRGQSLRTGRLRWPRSGGGRASEAPVGRSSLGRRRTRTPSWCTSCRCCAVQSGTSVRRGWRELVVCLRNSKVCFGYADSDRAGVAGDRGTSG